MFTASKSFGLWILSLTYPLSFKDVKDPMFFLGTLGRMPYTHLSYWKKIKYVKEQVVVSDYIYCDGMGFSETTEEFRHALAMLDRRLAERCDVVVEICGGIPKICKGEVTWI